MVEEKGREYHGTVLVIDHRRGKREKKTDGSDGSLSTLFY